jgi:16S rRNA (cytosine967-C5)-methyltransferase
VTRDPARSADPARRAAADLLVAVDLEAAYGNLLLPKLLRERAITGLDAAFATEIGYGALRRSGVLDVVIEAGAKRSIDTLDPPVRAVLRLGAYQLLHTRVPVHAAVSATVNVSREVAGERPAGLVNAVLRRVGERSWPEWVARLAPADSLGRLAFDRGYPRWIAEAMLGALDGDEAELDRALTDDAPVTHLVARPGRISRDALLAAAGDGAAAGPWSPYAVRLSGGDPSRIDAVRDGRAAVQDEGSQLVAIATAAAPIDGADGRWLDACAGPGGKAALLAALLPDDGRLLAADLHAHRADLVRRALGGDARAAVVVADATRPAWRPGAADRVLLDAPCTGLGALRRRPEARWRRTPADALRLRRLQIGLLGAAIDAVRPGGVVAYATCSPHPVETFDVLAACRESRGDIEVLDARESLPGVAALGRGPYVQLWPHRHGTDAMFVALVRRRFG